MTASDETPAVVDDYACRFDLQVGWVELTLDEGTKDEAEHLARDVVRRINPLTSEIEESAILREVADRAVRLNSDAPLLVASYYNEAGRSLADLVVDSYIDDVGPRPTPVEVQPMLLEWGNAELAGKPQVTYLELPAGSAVRVQSILKVKKKFGFGRRLAECINYAVFPPDTESIVTVTITWNLIQYSEEITQMVDEFVPTLRLVPIDVDGNEINPIPPR